MQLCIWVFVRIWFVVTFSGWLCVCYSFFLLLSTFNNEKREKKTMNVWVQNHNKPCIVDVTFQTHVRRLFWVLSIVELQTNARQYCSVLQFHFFYLTPEGKSRHLLLMWSYYSVRKWLVRTFFFPPPHLAVIEFLGSRKSLHWLFTHNFIAHMEIPACI